jgi:3-hydroxyacyl-[acyl-carrier-protein] dehydratase
MTGFGPGKIKDILPHRPPELLIDRVLEWIPRERIIAVKAITVEAIWYEGVVGSDYSYPGSLLVESFNQTAAILLVLAFRSRTGIAEGVPIFGSASGIHFDAPVEPGDIVQHHVYIDRIVDNNAILGGFSTVGDRTVLRVDREIVALRAKSDLPLEEGSVDA